MRKGDLFIVLILAGMFFLGTAFGVVAENFALRSKAAPAASVDPRIGEDIAELGKRTRQLAENQKAMQQEILQLHEDDKTIVGFVEMAFQSFFGGEPQVVPNSVRAER